MMNTALVAFSAVVCGSNELMNDIQRLVGSYITCRQTEYVSIEETTCVLRHARFPTDGSTHMRMGVGSHAHTVAGEAETDTQVALAALYGSCHRVRKIRKITVFHRVTSEIMHLGTFALKIQLNHRFQAKTSVVTCQRNVQFV